MSIYVGIDPGVSGCITCLDEDGIVQDSKKLKGLKEQDILIHLRELCISWGHEPVCCCIEHLWGYTGEHVNTGSRMFQLGQSVGWLEMALVALGIPTKKVTPQTWQKLLDVVPRATGKRKKRDKSNLPIRPKESKPQFKKRLKELALSLFPRKNLNGFSIIQDTADSFLLALVCKKFYHTLK